MRPLQIHHVRIGLVEIPVCQNQNVRRPMARESCVQKVRDRLRPCAGCGSVLSTYQWSRNALCSGCTANLARGAMVSGATEMVWVAIDPNRLLGPRLSDGDPAGRLVAAVLGALACRWQAAEPTDGRFSLFSRDSSHVLPSGHEHGLFSRNGCVYVEVASDKLPALRDLCDALARFGRTQYDAGVERGHNALSRLVAGEVSVDRYEEVRVRSSRLER